MKKNFTILMLLAFCCLGMRAEKVTVIDVITGDKLLAKYPGQSSTGEKSADFMEFNGMKFESTAVYDAKCAVRSDYDNAILLKSNYKGRGFVTTKSGGKAKTITITWGPGNSYLSSFFIYGSNEPYSSPRNLWEGSDEFIGQRLDYIDYPAGGSRVSTYTINGNFDYIGFQAYWGDGAENVVLDKIEIEWEVEETDVVIKNANMATFCSMYPRDFSNTGVTAYIATKAADDAVTFTPITKVPAGVGVLVKADKPGTYSVPCLAKDETPETFETNYLKGTTSVTTVDVTETDWTVYPYVYYTNYLFAYKNDDYSKVAFHPLAKSYELPSGKAYLSVPQNSQSSTMKIIFAGEDVTGIEDVKCDDVENCDAYNLQGIKVDNNYHGFVIKNGKKFYNR